RHIEPSYPRSVQAQIDGIRHLISGATGAASPAATPTGGRLIFRFQVLSRRRHADRVQAGRNGDAHIEGVDFLVLTRLLVPQEANLEDVLGVEGEIMPHRHAGARIKRQIVVELLVTRAFYRIALGIVNLVSRLQREIADGEPADTTR